MNSSISAKLTPEQVKEYRGCFVNGLMDVKYISKETNICERSITGMLYNENYYDENYNKSLKYIKSKEKIPFTLPIRQRYTEAVKRILSNYNIPIEERVQCMQENADKITYDSQTAIFIRDENDFKYLLIIENDINENSGYLIPYGKYKIEICIEENREYFSKFIYDKKEGINIKRINKFKNYWVTCDGRIISTIRGSFLKQFINPKGYKQILFPGFSSNKVTFKVHRLVAELFIPNPDNKPQINHIDGNKTNNHYTNLEWCTNKENQIHAIKTGLVKAKTDEEANQAKLTNKQVKEIRTLFKDGKYTISELGKMYNVTGTAISYILQYISYPNATDKNELPPYVTKK